MQATSPTAASGPIYYVTEIRNATLGELWRMSAPTISGKLGVILVKTLRLSSPPQVGMAFDDPLRCSVSDIPELTKSFDQTIRSLTRLGFSPDVAMRLPMLGEGTCCSLAFLGNKPTVYAQIVYGKMDSNGQELEESGLSFVSRDASTIWVTSAMPRLLNVPKMFNAQHHPGQSPESLLDAHNQRIGHIPEETLRVFDTESLSSTLREHESIITDFNVSRGFFRPMTDAEIRNMPNAKPT